MQVAELALMGLHTAQGSLLYTPDSRIHAPVHILGSCKPESVHTRTCVGSQSEQKQLCAYSGGSILEMQHTEDTWKSTG